METTTQKEIPIAESNIGQQVRTHLVQIRANSCYSVLRGLIDVCFVLSVLFVVGGMVGYWTVLGPSLGEHWLLYNVTCSCAGIVIVVILIATRQSALLLIDIADTLLHEHSKHSD